MQICYVGMNMYVVVDEDGTYGDILRKVKLDDEKFWINTKNPARKFSNPLDAAKYEMEVTK